MAEEREIIKVDYRLYDYLTVGEYLHSNIIRIDHYFSKEIDDRINISDGLAVFTLEARYPIGKPRSNTDTVGSVALEVAILPRTSRYKSTYVYPELEGGMGKWPISAASVTKDATDEYFRVELREVFRLDLVSFAAYGTPDYWWVIALANDIRNPFTRPIYNEILRVPSINRIQSQLIN